MGWLSIYWFHKKQIYCDCVLISPSWVSQSSPQWWCRRSVRPCSPFVSATHTALCSSHWTWPTRSAARSLAACAGTATGMTDNNQLHHGFTEYRVRLKEGRRGRWKKVQKGWWAKLENEDVRWTGDNLVSCTLLLSHGPFLTKRHQGLRGTLSLQSFILCCPEQIRRNQKLWFNNSIKFCERMQKSIFIYWI